MGNFKTTNPSTGEVLEEYQYISEEQIINCVKNSFLYYKNDLSNAPLSSKKQLVSKFREGLAKESAALALSMTQEMGKPISGSRAEITKCLFLMDHYLENVDDYLIPEKINIGPARKAEVHYCPIGPILLIMPWNFPVWQVIRCMIPNLLLGNTVLLKHSENVTGTALMLESIARNSGLAEGIFKVLLAEHDALDELYSSPYLSGISLTGSTRAGKIVAEKSAANLKKVVLELGGSDPYIVLADADIENTAKSIVTGRLINSGQSCISPKRIFLDSKISEMFLESLLLRVQEYHLGDPTLEETNIGPIARQDLCDGLKKQVETAISCGAIKLYQSEFPSKLKNGSYYPITVLKVSVRDYENNPVFKEEFFGPVFLILTFDDLDKAIVLANDSPFGLGAAVYTNDLEKGSEIAVHLLEAGAVSVNDFVKSDPRLPFGGIKESGIGREMGRDGLLEFANKKTFVCPTR